MNWRYILIVLTLGVIVGGGIIIYTRMTEIEIPIVEIPHRLKCEFWYKRIEKVFDKANFCEGDTDCKVITLGGVYVEFGCYKFVNVATDENELLREVIEYSKKCARAINECAPSPEVSCISNKCISVER